MRIIEIAPLPNGAHRNQSYTGESLNIPEGWAAIPEELEAQAAEWLPFVTATVENGVITKLEDNPAAREAAIRDIEV